MPRFSFSAHEWPRLLEWWKVDFFIWPAPPCLTELEQEEEHCLEAMLHWHDPAARVRTIHRGRHPHTLVDDNPASG